MSRQVSDIRDKIFDKKNKFTVVDTMIRIMETFGYTLKELRELPIPTYECMVQYLNKLDNAQAKQNKKR